MSKELNGPPGSPVGLCSGTATTSITAYAPLDVVPQTGQLGALPHPLKTINRAVRKTISKILGLIKFPSCNFFAGLVASSRHPANLLKIPSATATRADHF